MSQHCLPSKRIVQYPICPHVELLFGTSLAIVMLELTVESESSANLPNKSQMLTTEEDEASFDLMTSKITEPANRERVTFQPTLIPQ